MTSSLLTTSGLSTQTSSPESITNLKARKIWKFWRSMWVIYQGLINISQKSFELWPMIKLGGKSKRGRKSQG